MTVVGNTTYDANNNGVDKKSEETSQVESTESNEKKEVPKNIFDKVDTQTQIDTESDNAKTVERLSAIPGHRGRDLESSVKINGESYNKVDLVITQTEKSDYIDSLISGSRYKQRYSLFGGKISVVVRNRTAAETNAMYAYIRRILAQSNDTEAQIRVAEGDMAYIPLVAQIAEINGTEFPEMKEPLNFIESEGKEEKPGWYEDFLAWKKKPEGLTSALISIVQLFEYKYWTMTKEAANKNFWNTDTSIEE